MARAVRSAIAEVKHRPQRLVIGGVPKIYYLRASEGEELDGQAVSALGVRSRKLSTGLNGQS
jgi:hypothetical protein